MLKIIVGDMISLSLSVYYYCGSTKQIEITLHMVVFVWKLTDARMSLLSC
jgi:hypothetical protein